MFSKHARNTISFSLQTSSRSDYLSLSYLFHRSAVSEISLTKTSIVEQIIAKAGMIEADATNVIWKRRSKERRKRRLKRRRKSCEWEFWLQKWGFCWKLWLQRDVENVWFFVWWKNRFLWQSKTAKRYRFRERMLLKILRIRAFQILTNRCLLIGCKQKVDDDSWLIDKSTSVKALWKRTTLLMLSQIKWFDLSMKHANQIIDCKIELRDRFSKHWWKCYERNWRASCWCNLRTFWFDFECR